MIDAEPPAHLPEMDVSHGLATPGAEDITAVIRSVKDPELDMNGVDLGLIYDVENNSGDVSIKMTLTSPGCPSGPEMVADVERCVLALDGVDTVDVEIVWEPFWTPDRMDPRIRSFLGL